MSLPLVETVSFGRYRLSARIATGGMAEVYTAREVRPDGRAGPMVAVKRLLPHLVAESAIVRMFLNEAKITAQVRHPNVVTIHELGEAEDGEPYIAMELLCGQSFGDIRQKTATQGERIPLGITLKVLTDACRGLDAAHRAVGEDGRPLCIVHRDFTPDNIHVGVDGVVKVIDFGIAKAENLGAGTEPGTLKGKFFYMSPEMIAGRSVDHRADLYAAGVMLYEQLCGRRPFTGISPDEVLQRVAEGRPRRPTEFDPSVPPVLEAICLKALRQDPNDRFQSLDEFIRAIDLLGGEAEVASGEALAAYVQRLFPIDSDPKMAAIARARAQDPSQPEVAPAQAEVPASKPKAARPLPRPGKGTLVGGAAVVVVAAVIGLLVKSGVFRAAPVADRLAAAEATQDREARADVLEGLGGEKEATPAQLARAGELLLEVGAHPVALDLAVAFAARFPKSQEARLIEARAAMGLRQGKRAEAAIDAARELDPRSPEPDLVLAQLKELQADIPGATAALADAQRKDPRSKKVAVHRGYLLSQSGRLDEAAEVLGGVLRRDFHPEAAAELAFVRYRQERSGDALSLLRRALKRRPNLGRGHYYLGAVLFKRGERKEAEAAYLKAESLLPDDPRPLLALCQLYGHLKRAEDAKEVQERMRARFPDRAETLARQCEVR